MVTTTYGFRFLPLPPSSCSALKEPSLHLFYVRRSCTYQLFRAAMKAALPLDFYNHNFDRMDPELFKALRDSITSDVASWGVESAEVPEMYSPVSTIHSN